MPKLTLNTQDVQDFSAIPEDRYDARIAEVGDVKQGPKALYMRVTFEVTSGEYTGKKLFRNYTMEGEGLGFFVRDVNRLLGEDTIEIGVEGFDFDTDDLVGQECQIIVEEGEEYMGEPTNDITRVLAG